MMMTTLAPWAVLLCKFKNDSSEPPNAQGVPPFRTACETFFTKTNGGFNIVRFFSDMSHGSIDISGSKVFGWYTLNVNITGHTPSGDPILDKTQNEVVALAKQAAIDSGAPLNTFLGGVVVIMNVATGWAQGSPGWMAADWRRVDGRNFDGTLGARAPGGGDGTEAFGQEMGHGFGLDHSRRDGSNADYQDRWDIMSTLNAFSAPDADYAARGPGLNAWNMRGRGWLDESRVWRAPSLVFDQVILLRPLHRRDLSGLLAAELPPNDGEGGHGRYLVEFRLKKDWDAGIPRSAVLVHRFEGPLGQALGTHSYIMSGTNDQQDLVDGGVFTTGGGGPRLEVLKIDAAAEMATVRLISGPPKLVGITLSPDTVICGENSTGTVTVNVPSLLGSVDVDLVCDSPGFATVPNRASIPHNRSSKSFLINTPDFQGSFKTAHAVIHASYNGTSVAATLTVKPKAIAGILKSLTLFPSIVKGGVTSNGTVTLEEVVPTDTLVALAAAETGTVHPDASNTSSFVSVPDSVTIPAGQISAGFFITTEHLSPHSKRTATIIAMGPAGINKAEMLTVTS